ncbi:MAG: tetratricopeptide repeat protein [Bacteroidota bacterium]
MRHFLILTVLIIVLGCKNENSELGDKLFSKGEYEKAVEAYTEYLRMQPRDIKTIYNRGRAFEELEEYDKALEDFRRVIKEDPLNVNAHLSIASDFYYRLKDYENTIFFTEKAIKLEQDNVLAHTLKGKGHQKLGQLNEAMSAYNDAISVDKEYSDAYLSRGSLRIYLKQNSKACSDFKLAASLGTTQAEALVKRYCK